MKIKFLLAVLLFSNIIVFGQENCGTPTNLNPQHFEEEESENIVARNSLPSICIDVFFHIVRETNGTGGFNPSNINAVVNNLNQAFNPHKIYINNVGVGFINNSTFYNLTNNQQFNNLIATNSNPNAINFYLVNSAPWSGATYILSRALVVVNGDALKATSPHELGHCLNLEHTHRGSGSCNDFGGCAENINGSNCSSCGDYVCDTPADPCLWGQVNSNCQYIGGGGFNPDVTNIMSYRSDIFTECRTNFTNGQAIRMRGALLNASVLQPVISNSCAIPNLTGEDVICSSGETFLLDNGGSNVTWSVSSNLQILSSSNTSITVQPVNPLISGAGFIKAILPYETLQKDIWTGKPTLSTTFDCFNNPNHPMCGVICKTEFYHPDNTITLNVQGHTEWEVTKYGNFDWHIGLNTLYIQPYQAGTIALTLKAKNACGTSAPLLFQFSVTNCKSKSMNENQSYYKIYPNPSSDMVYISLKDSENQPLTDNVITGELYDLMGNLKSTVQIINNQASFSVQGLNTGIYVLKIYIDGQETEGHTIAVQ